MHITLSDGRVLGIETSKDADMVYISHAHSDHSRKGNIFSSPQTFDLLNLDGRTSILHKIDKDVNLHPAGHILGSTQIEFTNGHTVVYTGDMKLREGFTSGRAEIVRCDELHIDCTFGHPDFEFDSKEIIADRIDRWTRTRLMVGNNVVFGAYSTGKAQELIYILNKYSNITPVVDQNIEEKCKIYEKYGIKLDRVVIGSKEAAETMKGKFVYIVPFNFVNPQSEKWLTTQYKKVSFAIVTGWAKKYRYRYHAFPLSDHGGFSEILRYVEESGAKEIICHYGNAVFMSKYLRSKGYNSFVDKEWEYRKRCNEPLRESSIKEQLTVSIRI
ncbi:MAG: MBL fold metallo-hydrolase [Candidatus Micrarchaeia archaeon]